jgi:hypothetical protein
MILPGGRAAALRRDSFLRGTPERTSPNRVAQHFAERDRDVLSLVQEQVDSLSRAKMRQAIRAHTPCSELSSGELPVLRLEGASRMAILTARETIGMSDHRLSHDVTRRFRRLTT